MADLQVEIDSARLLAYRAAWLLAQGQPCGREGSMAKLKGSETYVAAARLGMQVCAGHGFSTESVMSFRYRESIVATISGGTSQIQRTASPAAWDCGATEGAARRRRFAAVS